MKLIQLPGELILLIADNLKPHIYITNSTFIYIGAISGIMAVMYSSGRLSMAAWMP